MADLITGLLAIPVNMAGNDNNCSCEEAVPVRKQKGHVRSADNSTRDNKDIQALAGNEQPKQARTERQSVPKPVAFGAVLEKELAGRLDSDTSAVRPQKSVPKSRGKTPLELIGAALSVPAELSGHNPGKSSVENTWQLKNSAATSKHGLPVISSVAENSGSVVKGLTQQAESNSREAVKPAKDGLPVLKNTVGREGELLPDTGNGNSAKMHPDKPHTGTSNDSDMVQSAGRLSAQTDAVMQTAKKFILQIPEKTAESSVQNRNNEQLDKAILRPVSTSPEITTDSSEKGTVKGLSASINRPTAAGKQRPGVGSDIANESIYEKSVLQAGQVSGVEQGHPFDTAEQSMSVRAASGIHAAGRAGEDLSAGITEQIITHVRQNQPSPEREITITLSPPQMGKIRIQFRQTGDGVTGLFHVEKSSTRYEIERELPRIVASMQQNGIQLNRLEIVPAQAEQSDGHKYSGFGQSGHQDGAGSGWQLPDERTDNSTGRDVFAAGHETNTGTEAVLPPHADADGAINVYI